MLNIQLIRLVKPAVRSSWESEWSEKDVAGIKYDYDGGNYKPESDSLADEHGYYKSNLNLFQLVQTIIDLIPS